MTKVNKIALQVAVIAITTLSLVEVNAVLVQLGSKAAKSKKAADAALLKLVKEGKAHFSTYFFIRTEHRPIEQGGGQDTLFTAKHRTHREDVYKYVSPVKSPAESAE